MKTKKKIPLVTDCERLAAPRELVKQAVPDWQAKYAEFQKADPLAARTDIVSGELVARLTLLKTAALSGDERSYLALAAIAMMACSILEHASLLHADAQKALAKRSEEWPVLLSYLRGTRNKTVLAVEALPLAEDLARVMPAPPSPPKGIGPLKNGRRKKTYDLDTPTNHTIDFEFRRLRLENPEKYNLARDVVTQEMLDEWCETIFQRVCQRRDYLENPHLRELGLANARSKQTDKDKNKGRETDTFRSNIKDGIRYRIEESFSGQFSIEK